MRFSALHFGGRASPYIACMGQQRILKLARGQPNDLNSPFHFVKVVLNLPTSITWDPSLPHVMRIRKDGELASAQVDYVDDIHPTARGTDDTNATVAAKYLKSRMNSLGNQADDKKYRRPTCRPGAWKGEIMHTYQPLPQTDAMEVAEGLEMNDSGTEFAASGYPTLTQITSELLDHCGALLELFDSELPRADFARPASSTSYRYYVGDASREGLGGATQFPDLSIRGRRGVWEPSFADGGSNLREAQNQVNHLIQEVRAGLHDGCEVWAFTDNGCWSAVWLKGLSTAKHLFMLVLRLKIECRIHEVYLHVCHISGDRMIETGLDGWSRGDFETGDDFSGLLAPEDWFWKGHLPGVHVWTPPPGAALIALKQLSQSKQKRPHELTHIVMIPRLLYWEEWQSRFEKEMDVWFAMHTGESWPRFAHEPLIVGPIHGYSDLNRKRWWELAVPCQKCQKRVTFESGISCANFGATRLRFPRCEGAWCATCFKAHDLDCFEIKLPRDFNGTSLAELDDEKRFCVARPGDHICTSFQCPNCQSQNIRGRSLDPRLARDQAFEALVIQATLDAFWSATTTVASHVTNVRFMSRYGKSLGFIPMPSVGPIPLYKHGGMLQAILLLLRSTEKGKKKATVRATLTKIWEASPEAHADLVLSSSSRKGRYVATHAPSESRWYESFNLGVSARMGDAVSQDRAYTIEVLHRLVASYEVEWT
eukprot:CCRYP_002220-RA/>CCRYP_002220-RA protein AED:0.33 eAED:0.28 QI:0/0/0/1/0.25/0.2/5/0/708